MLYFPVFDKLLSWRKLSQSWAWARTLGSAILGMGKINGKPKSSNRRWCCCSSDFPDLRRSYCEVKNRYQNSSFLFIFSKFAEMCDMSSIVYTTNVRSFFLKFFKPIKFLVAVCAVGINLWKKRRKKRRLKSGQIKPKLVSWKKMKGLGRLSPSKWK